MSEKTGKGRITTICPAVPPNGEKRWKNSSFIFFERRNISFSPIFPADKTGSAKGENAKSLFSPPCPVAGQIRSYCYRHKRSVSPRWNPDSWHSTAVKNRPSWLWQSCYGQCFADREERGGKEIGETPFATTRHRSSGRRRCSVKEKKDLVPKVTIPPLSLSVPPCCRYSTTYRGWGYFLASARLRLNRCHQQKPPPPPLLLPAATERKG